MMQQFIQIANQQLQEYSVKAKQQHLHLSFEQQQQEEMRRIKSGSLGPVFSFLERNPLPRGSENLALQFVQILSENGLKISSTPFKIYSPFFPPKISSNQSSFIFM